MEPNNNNNSLEKQLANMVINDFTFNKINCDSKNNSKDFTFNDDNDILDNNSLREFTLNDYAKELDLEDLGKNTPSPKSVVILDLKEDLNSKESLAKRTLAERDENKENKEEPKIVKKINLESRSR